MGSSKINSDDTEPCTTKNIWFPFFFLILAEDKSTASAGVTDNKNNSRLVFLKLCLEQASDRMLTDGRESFTT